MAQNEYNDDSTRIAEPQAELVGQPAISVRGLSKRFGSQNVLTDVSFDIAGHEMLVALGPSGSGKTTLLRIIAGLEQPDGGEILLKGQRVTHLGPQARKLGVVFQEHALFQRMSVEQNIAFGLKLRRVPDEQVAAAQFSVYAFNGANIAPASTAVVSRGVAYGKAKYRRSLRASRQ